MNPRQKSVLWAGIGLVVLAAVFPPWVFVDEYRILARSAALERLAGRSFYFAPPAPSLPPECADRIARIPRDGLRLYGDGPSGDPDPRSTCGLIASVTRIDTRRLTVEWAAIVLVVAGLLLVLRSRPVPPGTSEPSDAQSVDPEATESHTPSSLDAHPPKNVSTNLPNKTAKPSDEIEKLLEFFRNADPQEFSATIVAIFRGLKVQPRQREDVYFWLVENRHRFGGLVYGDDRPRDNHEAAMVARAKRLKPDLEKHFRSEPEKYKKVASANPRVAPHWAIADLLDETVDLDALAEEAMKEVSTESFITDHDPILFLLDRQNPQLPPWLPEKYGRRLTHQERVEWFDQLLRRDYGNSNRWPPDDSVSIRRREIMLCLYRMYIDRLTGALQKPGFLVEE